MMRNTPNLHGWIAGIMAVLFLSMMALAKSADEPLNKVGTTAMIAAQYGTDDKEMAKAPELIDGNAKTRWICRTALPIRIVLDMGVARTVGKLRIANYYTGANFERGFKVVDIFIGDAIASATGGTPTVADKELAMSTADGPAWTEIALAKPVKGRYVTMRVKSNWGGNAIAANEVEIFTVEADTPGAVAAPPKNTEPTGAKITVIQYDAAGKEVSKPIELTDGNPATRWMAATPTPPIRLYLDLGAAKTVTKVRIANYCSPTKANFERGIKTVDLFIGDALAPATGGTPAMADVKIAISDANGPAWTEMALPKPVTGRYITLRVKDNWGGVNYAANEIEVTTAADATPAKPAEPGK